MEGKVTKTASFGAFVELEGGIDGLIHISELSNEHVNKAKDVVTVGSIVKCRVKNINTEEKRIGLSLRDAAEGAVPAASEGSAPSVFKGAFDEAFKAAEQDEKAEKEAEKEAEK